MNRLFYRDSLVVLVLHDRPLLVRVRNINITSNPKMYHEMYLKWQSLSYSEWTYAFILWISGLYHYLLHDHSSHLKHFLLIFEFFLTSPSSVYFSCPFPFRPNWWKPEVNITEGSNGYGTRSHHTGTTEQQGLICTHLPFI